MSIVDDYNKKFSDNIEKLIPDKVEVYMTPPKHECIDCRKRHDGCTYFKEFEFISDNFKHQVDCPYFVIGKCFVCKHRNMIGAEYNDICYAEDMSGHGCPNFAE